MKTTLPTNPFKAALKSGTSQIGLWSSLCSPIGAELISGAGFDWLLFDSEHSPIEVSGLMPLLQAAAKSDSHSVVRVAWNDSVLIKRALDIGAQTILVPFVQNAQEATNAVAACKYPPLGIRGIAGATRASGFGRIPNYVTQANDEICVIVQVETKEALENIAEIAAVKGLDGIFIGPSDLSASLGHPGNPAHSDVQTAIQAAAKAINSYGLAAGILATSSADTAKYLKYGFTFVAAGVDTSLLTNAVDALRKNVLP
ncbi:HpcH/HpaI aldolase family protein [Falsihalocynthiibacter arcticus]|uniref:Hydroxypyruvate/pyruvate aldolase n=1 Tax=Falsihalocynthiibacter arcticus TaxID=1579316 RepID=A0A126UWK1_9RHOB|nr:HpcH/HpaI aldolase/citrate lyase family protein [Falsihalocynthiibacter arcticus]AML50452.1 4-hydroxy-2-oxo-heptane-1,7-dioate aldolase [Falsihalocynthiibacter arcticus]